MNQKDSRLLNEQSDLDETYEVTQGTINSLKAKIKRLTTLKRIFEKQNHSDGKLHKESNLPTQLEELKFKLSSFKEEYPEFFI